MRFVYIGMIYLVSVGIYHHIHGVSKFRIDFFYCRPLKSRVLNGCRSFIYFFEVKNIFEKISSVCFRSLVFLVLVTVQLFKFGRESPGLGTALAPGPSPTSQPPSGMHPLRSHT